jgi:hypothetical protein
MNNKSQSDWEGLWGILWRSFVFLPYMLGVFVIVGCVRLSRWVLPVHAALSVYYNDWWLGAAAFALWLMALWSYRRFHLCQFYEAPPSLL